MFDHGKSPMVWDYFIFNFYFSSLIRIPTDVNIGCLHCQSNIYGLNRGSSWSHWRNLINSPNITSSSSSTRHKQTLSRSSLQSKDMGRQRNLNNTVLGMECIQGTRVTKSVVAASNIALVRYNIGSWLVAAWLMYWSIEQALAFP